LSPSLGPSRIDIVAILEFEKPLVEVEKKVAALRALASAEDEGHRELEHWERRLARLRRKVFGGLTRWQRVQLARHMDRPHATDYIQGMLTEFFELHGDRLGFEDPAVITGLGRLLGMPLVVIGHEKGRTPQERMQRRNAMAHPEGIRKALRFMNLAERFRRPVLSLVDTPGAYPGVEAEARGQVGAIADNLLRWSTLRTPSVALIIGEGGSGGALALAMADRVLMMEHTIYSVVSPEACAAILWRDEAKKELAAEALRLTATDALSLGLIHEIVREPPGGAHRDPRGAIQASSEACHRHFLELMACSEDELLARRRENYRRMGVIAEEGVKARR
jgi:acetyl-CoA carboxylase carboxyl transferase subunit alpha